MYELKIHLTMPPFSFSLLFIGWMQRVPNDPMRTYFIAKPMSETRAVQNDWLP